MVNSYAFKRSTQSATISETNFDKNNNLYAFSRMNVLISDANTQTIGTPKNFRVVDTLVNTKAGKG